MKTIGVRALRENPGVLSQMAAAGEYLLVTNHSEPVSLSIPFDDDLLRSGVHLSLALKLYQDGSLSLSKAAKLAKKSVEDFLLCLAGLGIVVVNQTAQELDTDLKQLDD